MADKCDCLYYQERATKKIDQLYDMVTEFIESHPQYCYELVDRVFAMVNDFNDFDGIRECGGIEAECTKCKSVDNSQ